MRWKLLTDHFPTFVGFVSELVRICFRTWSVLVRKLFGTCSGPVFPIRVLHIYLSFTCPLLFLFPTCFLYFSFILRRYVSNTFPICSYNVPVLFIYCPYTFPTYFSYTVPLLFLYFSYTCPILFPCFSFGFPILVLCVFRCVSRAVPMFFPCFSYDFPMLFLYLSYSVPLFFL